MENFVYVIIAIAYIVYSVVRANNKNKAKQNRPQANSQPPTAPRPPQTLSEQQQAVREREARQRELQQQRNRSQQAKPQTASTSSGKSVFDILREELEGRREQAPIPEPMEHDPFLEEDRPRAKPVSNALREERAREKSSGLTPKNHFSEERLVEEFTRTHAQGKQIAHHTHDYFNPKKDKLKGRMEASRAKSHPINKLLKGQKNIRNAIILKEVLDRKF